MKKIVSVILILVLCASMGIQTTAAIPLPKDMDKLEVIAAAYYYVGTIEDEEVTDNVTVEKITPLYDIDSAIRAYYVKFSSGAYAVISNNIDNPQAIEFGKGTNEAIEEILNSNPDEKVIYNNPLNVQKLSSVQLLSNKIRKEYCGIDYYYEDLNEKNRALSECVKAAKKDLLKYAETNGGDEEYGFVGSANLPKGKYKGDLIRNAGTVDWAITSDYIDIASDHCGATAVTNLALYFAANGKKDLKLKTKRDTFIAVHSFVKNGPKVTIAEEAKEYFKDRGYTLNYNTETATIKHIKDATTNERPCGILLANKINDWHWVVSVGWREYTSSGDFYVRIVNNWNNTIDRYYKPNTGSQWWTVTSYWVS